MTDKDILISDLNDISEILNNNGYGGWCKAIRNAVAMLKEQDSEKKRIMKVIWDTLHEGLSIDTVADQDWVYEQIRHRIEDT